MSKLDRRSFITGASAVPFALWLQGCGEGGGGGNGGAGGAEDGGGESPGVPAPGGGRVRHDARSPEGRAMLEIYGRAVETMKIAIAEGDPTSWVFQWYIHGVKGPSSTTAQNKAGELARIYPDPDPHRDLAEEVWNTCQPHYPGDDENFFLPWHRMYVYFFETVIRQVSGDASFTLPYWNYSTSDAATRGVIPPEFRQGPLLVDKRNPGVNDGRPIQQGEPGDPLSMASLGECTYEPVRPKQGFNMRLDRGLHGNIHVLTGNTQNMGAVPWAAGDPVFWAHHCNIDRLWASWNAAGRENPDDAQWLDQTFVFADASGRRVEATVRDFTAIAPLGYSYDRLEPVPDCEPSVQGLVAEAPSVLAAASAPVALTKEPVRVGLGGLQGAAPVTSLVAGDSRIYLVVEGLTAQTQPGVLYHLYLGLPDGADPATAEEHLVGTVNFFVAAHGGHEGTAAEEEKFSSFECTDLIHRLDAGGAELALTISPAAEPASEARPVLGKVTLVEQ